MEDLSELSDGHHILGVCFQVVDGPIPPDMKVPKEHHQFKRQTTGCSRTKKDLDRYKDLLAQWFRAAPELDYDNMPVEEAERALKELMEATVEIGQSKPNWGKKLWRTYRDGWSPVLLALQAHLFFIEKLQSRMGNSSRKYLWPRRTWMHQITQASQEWEKKVQRAFKRDKDPHRAQKQLGECGEFGPWYYRLITEPPHMGFLEEE